MPGIQANICVFTLQTNSPHHTCSSHHHCQPCLLTERLDKKKITWVDGWYVVAVVFGDNKNLQVCTSSGGDNDETLYKKCCQQW